MRSSPAIMRRLLVGAWVILAVLPAGCRREAAGPVAAPAADDGPPLEISFTPALASHGLRGKPGLPECGVPAGRNEAYDPATGVFHVHFKARDYAAAGFEVTKLAERSVKPVVFRLTGVPEGYGCLGHPLVLAVDGKEYALDASCQSQYFWAQPFDETLVRSERKDGAVTVAFTEKGRALLKPGAQVSLLIDTGW